MILDTLSNKPVIGMASTVGTVGIELLGIINPVLSFISLLIGISVSMVTLIYKLKK